LERKVNLISELLNSLDFPSLPERIGKAAGVLVEPIPGCDERFCVAVVGIMDDGQKGSAVTVNPRITRSLLGGDLAKSLLGLAQLCSQDYNRANNYRDSPERWQPPFDGINLTQWREFAADDIQSLLEQAGLIFSTLSHSGDPKDPPIEEYIAPSVAEEENFKRAVRNTVLMTNPDLSQYFDNKVSAISGGKVPFKVDYLSSSLTACFSTINPKSNRKSLLRRHQEALWRIARSRDCGLFKPAAAELIVWHPEPGIPLFTNNEYEIAREIEMELVHEARKEDIEIVPQYRESLAAEHVINRELALSAI
jgi:hypothetical protein